MSDVASRMADGKLFHARAAATGNARSPKVNRRTGGTVSDVDSDERRCMVQFIGLWLAEY